MAVYGHIGEYVECLEQYFIASLIDCATQKRAIFLTVCGLQTYSLLQNLLLPEKPSDKTFADLTALMKVYFNLKLLVIAKLYKFSQRQQKAGETVKEFIPALQFW